MPGWDDAGRILEGERQLRCHAGGGWGCRLGELNSPATGHVLDICNRIRAQGHRVSRCNAQNEEEGPLNPAGSSTLTGCRLFPPQPAPTAQVHTSETLLRKVLLFTAWPEYSQGAGSQEPHAYSATVYSSKSTNKSSSCWR